MVKKHDTLYITKLETVFIGKSLWYIIGEMNHL